MQYSESGVIYQEFWGHCGKYRNCGLWGQLAASNDIRGQPPEPSHAVEALRAKFSLDELLESSVLVRDFHGHVKLNPDLADHDATIVPLRFTPEANPFDFICCGNLLHHDTLPLLAALKDGRMKEQLEQTDNVLCVPSSMSDMAILWSIDIPAVPVTGLVDISKRMLRKFCRRFGLRRAGEPTPSIDPPQLVFVGWNISRLELQPPPDLKKLTAHFRQIERSLQVSMDDEMYAWKPHQEEVKRVRFCLKHGDKEDVKGAILNSLTNSTCSLTWRAGTPQPTDLASALARLIEELHSTPIDNDRVRRAFSSALALVKDDCIVPLLKEADETSDAMERNLHLAAATTGHMLHSQGIALITKALMERQNLSPGRFAALPQKELSQQISLVNSWIKLNGAIQENRKNSKTY